MNSGAMLRASRIAFVLCALGSLVFLVPSAVADTTAGSCRNWCVYDIELQAETKLPRGTFGLTARLVG